MLQLCHVSVDLGDHFIGSLADPVQRCLQLRCFLAVGPACHIGKAVVAGINAVVLTYREGHGLGLHLFLISCELRLSGVRRFIRIFIWIDGMELLMRHLMDGGLDGLHLTHVFLDSDAILHGVEISLGTALNLFKADRNRTGLFQRLEEHFVLRYIAGQLVYSDCRKGLSVRLADIENIYHLKGRHQHFSGFLFTGSVRVPEDFAGDRIRLIHLHFLFVRRRRENANSAFAFLHLPAELLLPCRVTGHQCGIRFLQGNENRIV